MTILIYFGQLKLLRHEYKQMYAIYKAKIAELEVSTCLWDLLLLENLQQHILWTIIFHFSISSMACHGNWKVCKNVSTRYVRHSYVLLCLIKWNLYSCLMSFFLSWLLCCRILAKNKMHKNCNQRLPLPVRIVICLPANLVHRLCKICFISYIIWRTI